MASESGENKSRWLSNRHISGENYDAPYAARAKAGENVHGEADFVEALGPKSVLDAGCGTGRVAIELARRGIDVVGVDIDERLLGVAQAKAPQLEWHLDDISTVDLGRQFDMIVMSGNVMIFVAPGTVVVVLKNMSRQLATVGMLVEGFQLSMGLIDLVVYVGLA
jgi:2-polyprenyl-3-methyl-5-hydroxy-6-metoxy-1,4-benzoquinol methylase